MKTSNELIEQLKERRDKFLKAEMESLAFREQSKLDGATEMQEACLKEIDKCVQEWAVKLGIYESAEKVNIPDTLDLTEELKQRIKGK